ncbi:unnamed protein product [Miscanthus lutarioriparius]|uniref:DNA helicase Pif1-like 2B domain-containing protein n=1 Tax=Miscanthus lutarioriparius TaxID=422564 RepID=A0A811MVF9_9POAL|nr:unnamed protein product [Miscanthus lutarioriparius]
MEKYLFKYTNKGPDLAKVAIQNKEDHNAAPINEIKQYLDCRCMTPNDAAWCLLQFDIHRTDPSIERLHAHLPLENSIIYAEDDNLEEVVCDPRNTVTKLTAWFEANKTHPQAREFTYVEFPEHWTWHADGKYWQQRRNNRAKIGRITNISPNEGEVFYLRMLLHIVKGARCYSDLRNVAGHHYPTFQATCEALGLLGDDREWSHAMTDAAHWALPYQLCQLFVTMLLFCQVASPARLFDEFAQIMGDDMRYRILRLTPGIPEPLLQSQIRSYVLLELDNLLKNAGYTLDRFQLPQPEDENMRLRSPSLLPDEKIELQQFAEWLLSIGTELAAGINSQIMSQIATEEMSYYSCDTIDDSSANYCTVQCLYPTEFLNTICMSGLPDHHLQLKVGVPIMLLRNLDPTKGLCNGTRLIVTQLTV